MVTENVKVTRGEFQNLPIRYGGDLWNNWKLLDLCFQYHNVDAVRIDCIGSGLSCSVTLFTAEGQAITGTLYENGHFIPYSVAA